MSKPQKLLLIAAALSLLVWAVPFLRPLLLPLTYLNTHLHEFAHALAAALTGGATHYIAVNADGSGYAKISGGNIVVTASAGYPGTAILGGALIAAARTEAGAVKALGALAVALALTMALFVRADLVGIISGIFWLVALALAAKRLRQEALIVATQFLGLQLALTSFQALFALLHITAHSPAMTDARILQEATWIPAILWAVTWAGISLAAIALGLKAAWAPVPRKKTP